MFKLVLMYTHAARCIKTTAVENIFSRADRARTQLSYCCGFVATPVNSAGLTKPSLHDETSCSVLRNPTS
jgi:hypothetical protein